jgi:hypothetical protein
MSNEVTTIPQRTMVIEAPTHSFDQLVRMAASFAKSGLFGVKDADSALSLLLIAQSEGLHPAKVMRDFDVIQGRLAKKSEAMLRDFQASGGRVEWVELTDTRACAKFAHPLSPVPVKIDWDMERAKKAGLATKQGDMYQKYSRAMLRSRCISEGVRSTAPGATSQVYTPEEVRQIIAEEPTAAAEPVAIQQAVTEAAAEVKNEMLEDEFDALVMTLDVKTKPELVAAYNAGLKTLKENGNEAQFKKFKSWRDEMLAAIETGAI